MKGLCDTLRNELILYSTDVSILCAPTMNSPGYASGELYILSSYLVPLLKCTIHSEMKTKPRITAEIEGEDGHPMDKVAEKLVSGLFKRPANEFSSK